MVEHGTENAGVDSSSLSLGTSCYRSGTPASLIPSGSSSAVERVLAKDEVEGSTPFFRSILKKEAKLLKTAPPGKRRCPIGKHPALSLAEGFRAGCLGNLVSGTRMDIRSASLRAKSAARRSDVKTGAT